MIKLELEFYFQSWPYEATSIDSGSIDPEWNRIVEPSADSEFNST